MPKWIHPLSLRLLLLPLDQRVYLSNQPMRPPALGTVSATCRPVITLPGLDITPSFAMKQDFVIGSCRFDPWPQEVDCGQWLTRRCCQHTPTIFELSTCTCARPMPAFWSATPRLFIGPGIRKPPFFIRCSSNTSTGTSQNAKNALSPAQVRCGASCPTVSSSFSLAGGFREGLLAFVALRARANI